MRIRRCPEASGSRLRYIPSTFDTHTSRGKASCFLIFHILFDNFSLKFLIWASWGPLESSRFPLGSWGLIFLCLELPRAPLGGTLGHIGMTLGLLRGSLGATGTTLGVPWALLVPLGATLEGCWRPLGAALVSLGLSLDSLGLSLVPLGLFLISFGVSWAPWEPFGGSGSHFYTVLRGGSLERHGAFPGESSEHLEIYPLRGYIGRPYSTYARCPHNIGRESWDRETPDVDGVKRKSPLVGCSRDPRGVPFLFESGQSPGLSNCCYAPRSYQQYTPHKQSAG